MSTKELFDLLTGSEHEMTRIHGSSHPFSSSSKSEPEKKEIGTAFKAEVVIKSQTVKSDHITGMEKLIQDFELLARRNERLESRMNKF